MKRLHIIALSTVALAVFGVVEVFWRMEHVEAGLPVPSPSGNVVAQHYYLPEGGVVPYGNGVYLHRTWQPFRSIGSTLVFAGNCGASLEVVWMSERELEIRCSNGVAEFILSERENFKVLFVSGGDVSANKKLQPSANAPAE